MNPRVSIVVCTRNRIDLLKRSLPTVLTQDARPDEFEVIVVAKGSDGSREWVLSQRSPDRPALSVIDQTNSGLAAARNLGWRAATAPIVLFMDDDILCEPSLVRAHLRAQECYGPSVVKGAVPNAADCPPSVATDWAFSVGESWMDDIGPDLRTPWPRHTTVDANASVPRAVLEEFGGYDESMRIREQVELALRLGKAGIPFYFAPDAVGRHFYSRDTDSLIDRDATLYGPEDLILCRKYPEFRPYSALARIREGGIPKRLLRRFASNPTFGVHRTLRLPLRAFEVLRQIPLFRGIGVRLLQASLGAAMFASARKAAGSWAALRSIFEPGADSGPMSTGAGGLAAPDPQR